MQPLHSDPVLTRYYSRQFLLSLDKALAPQINCRYQTAGEWIHDICAISGEESSATIQVLPADLRHAHPEGMPTPGAGKTSAAERPPPERTVFIPPHAGSPHALFAATAT